MQILERSIIFIIFISISFENFNLFKKNTTEAVIIFKNIKCKSLDESFANFTYCRLKAIGRSNVSMSLRVALFQTPVTNISMGFELFKKANGYRPFLYNITADFCHLMVHRHNPVLSLFISWLAKASNINHTCPYTSDIIVDQLILSDDLVKIPLPSGDYLMRLSVGAYGIWRAVVKVFFQKTSN